MAVDYPGFTVHREKVDPAVVGQFADVVMPGDDSVHGLAWRGADGVDDGVDDGVEAVLG